MDHRERLARGRRRPARPALLQHRHLHLLLDRHQPQAPRAPRQGPAHRRPRPVREDAQEPGREAQGDLPPTQIAEITGSTAHFEESDGSRSSPTRPSGTCASRSNGPCGCGGRSPRTRSPPSAPTRSSRSSRRGRDDPRCSTRRAHRADSTDRASHRKDVDRDPHGPPEASRRCSTRPIWTPSPSATPRPRSSPTARATPSPTRSCETARTCRCPGAGRPTRPTPTARLVTIEYRTAIDDYLAGRGPPLRPRRLGRPQQDEDRLRDPLTRHFYRYIPPRPLDEIDAEIKQLEAEIQELLREVTE